MNTQKSLKPQLLRSPKLSDDALYGLPGLVVRAITPHTEAHPAALLFQFLTAYGNTIGRNAYFTTDGTRQRCNLNCIIVGRSAKGKKGTSWNHIRNLFSIADPSWEQNRIASGLASGEGLVYAVKDEAKEDSPDLIPKTGNNGHPDKRLLVVETEFAGTLKVLKREGNTLSTILRDAWDRGDFQTLTKQNPIKATGAHISIVGHITKLELDRELSAIEATNGFANRFLWVWVDREKIIPFADKLETRRNSAGFLRC